MKFNKIIVTSFLALILSACGGSPGGSSGGSLQPMDNGRYSLSRSGSVLNTVININGCSGAYTNNVTGVSVDFTATTEDKGATWKFSIPTSSPLLLDFFFRNNDYKVSPGTAVGSWQINPVSGLEGFIAQKL